MRLRHTVVFLVFGFALAAGCSSDDDEADGTAGAAGADGGVGGGGTTGTGGSGADAGPGTGGTSGTSGTTGAGGTGNVGSGTDCQRNADCDAPEQCISGRCGTIITATCQGLIYQCGNGIDDDGDGLTDMNDPDCLGPCSNNEANFHNCIPGGGSNACVVDCYFDKDSGSGNDTCEWDHRCDPLQLAEGQACPYLCDTTPGCDLSSQEAAECIIGCDESPTATNQTCSYLYQEQTTTCESFCGPLTPNGCDCFGCCDIMGDGDYVFVGSTTTDRKGVCADASCTLEKAIAKDYDACKKCIPVAGCLNTCETCEICIGRKELPPECTPTTPDAGEPGCPQPQCDAGVQRCGFDCHEPCPAGSFCLTGCCVTSPT